MKLNVRQIIVYIIIRMLSHNFNFTLLKSDVYDILNNDSGILFQDTRYGVDRARAIATKTVSFV